MLSLFLGLTLVNLLCLGIAVALGYRSLGDAGASKGSHILFGAIGTLVCVAVHCVVFTYFIATAKWVQHAIAVKHLDPALAAPTRSFKMQAFPAALLAMASVFVAAILGAARDNYGIDRAWHHVGAVAAVAINLAVALIEYRAIARNGRLIDGVLDRIHTSGNDSPGGAVNATAPTAEPR